MNSTPGTGKTTSPTVAPTPGQAENEHRTGAITDLAQERGRRLKDAAGERLQAVHVKRGAAVAGGSSVVALLVWAINRRNARR
ncbi:hypothetical protein, partial [Actinocorallia lasiicapitis]